MAPTHALLVSAILTFAPAEASHESARPSEPEPAADTTAYRTEDVRYTSGDLTLAALLMIPESVTDPAPAAVIIQGSGASDRSNVWSRLVAEELVAEGLVVLLTDKRGTGASEGDWRRASFGDRAADAVAGLGFLAGRPEVAADRIGLVGLSQGGWVAPLAAARSRRVAFVVNVSGASVSYAEQSFHEMAATTREAGFPEAAVAGVLELNRAAGEYAATGEWKPYAEARERGLEQPWAPIADGFPAEPGEPIWTFIRKNAGFDPMPYWILLSEPVLVLYGEEDESDNVPVAESVRRLEYAFGSAGKEDYRITVIPGAGHGFLDMERHGLMAEFSEELRRWIRMYAGR